MTNYDRIKKMNIGEMALRNIKHQIDCKKNPYWETSDGYGFSLLEKHKAIQHEIEWLNSESEG